MGRVFACSDLHGMLHLWKNIVETLEPDDTIFVLGDCGDRGPHPWETLKAVLNEPRAILLKGNHEDMLVNALGKGYGRQFNLLRSNGGKDTYHQCLEESDWAEWRLKLKRLPTHAEYQNAQGETIYLSHAGYTPWIDDDGVIGGWNWDEDLLWSRDHFLDPWPEDEMFQKAIIVHGHTPIPYLLDDIDPACKMGDIEPGALIYCGGHKTCIDTGAVFTGICVLLDLDTWDEHIFISEPYMT